MQIFEIVSQAGEKFFVCLKIENRQKPGSKDFEVVALAEGRVILGIRGDFLKKGAVERTATQEQAMKVFRKFHPEAPIKSCSFTGQIN